MLSFLIIGNAQGRLRYSWVWNKALQLLPSPEFAVWARRVLHKVASSSIPLSTEGINSTDSSKRVFPFDSFESFTLVHGKFGQTLNAIVGCDTVQDRYVAYLLLQTLTSLLTSYYGRVTELHFLFESDQISLMLNELVSQGIFIDSDPGAIIPTLSLTDRPSHLIPHDDD